MRARERILQFFALISFLSALALESAAQPTLIDPAPTGAPAVAAPSLADKRAENAEQLRIAMRKLEANGATDAVAVQEVAYYQTRDALLTQQEAIEQQIKDTESRKAEMEARVESPPVDTKQYKFADLDKLKDDVAAAQARASLGSDKLAMAKANLEKAAAAVKDCQVKRREAQEAYDKRANGPNAAQLTAALERARQDASLANEALALRKREVEREELAQKVVKLGIRARQDQIARIGPQVKFTEADFNEQIERIKKNEESATASLNQAEANRYTADADLRNAKQKLATATDENRPILTEEVAALWRTREKFDDETDSLRQRLQRFTQLREAWRRRYELATSNRDGTDHDHFAKLKLQQQETIKVLEDLSSDVRMQIVNMGVVRSSLASVEKKIEAAAKGPPGIVLQIAIQQKQLEETLKIYEKNLVWIENSRRVHEKLLDEIGATVEALTPKAIALGVWYRAETVWNSKLLEIGGEPVKIGDTVKGLTILIIGWILSRSTSGVFANRFLKRFRLSKDATSAIRALVFYCLLMFVALTALNTVGVPLTAFTILGGGLAIGVGFGSQALINNFIGGLIMLAERPVRLGERITFKEMDGVVEDVGFRCTKLRTQADHLVTIPNSTLVNESIENIDRRRTIRRTFTIAVTYNISREQLADGVQAIRDILEEKDIRERIHPIVGFEEFSPRVHFCDFAAESLNIQVVYWYAPVDSWAFTEHSERVNFRIMEEFDRLGIDFAFPSKTAYVKHPRRSSGRSRGDSYAA
jgi:small-conductance mechanosensitive channel